MTWSDKNGTPNFDNRAGTAQTGAHEDGHTLGLRRENDPKNSTGSQQGANPNDMMNDGSDGTYVSPKQRIQAINLIIQQQGK